MGGKTLSYEEYLASNIWKCVDSPTNAHHWIEIQDSEDGQYHTGLWYCKYCKDSKRLNVHWKMPIVLM